MATKHSAQVKKPSETIYIISTNLDVIFDTYDTAVHHTRRHCRNLQQLRIPWCSAARWYRQTCKEPNRWNNHRRSCQLNVNVNIQTAFIIVTKTDDLSHCYFVVNCASTPKVGRMLISLSQLTNLYNTSVSVCDCYLASTKLYCKVTGNVCDKHAWSHYVTVVSQTSDFLIASLMP